MQNLNNFFRNTFLVLVSLLISFASCKKDDDDKNNPIPPTGSTLKTTISGKVTDINNQVMPGVTVVLDGSSSLTDQRGHFKFVNVDVPKDRFVLRANKSGYFDCIKGTKTQSGAANYVNLVMQELPVAVNISGTAGGVVNLTGGARITFPANAFVDAAGNAYTGNVKVYARHFNPAANGFEAIVPGGDLLGVTLADQPVSLYSLGMIEGLLKDNSGVNEIKLKAGINAQLRFPIDASQSASALATIPMWHLDKTTGIWKEEGSATKNGNFYDGNVNHFSTWNCDYQGDRTDISGKVVDCQNNPMPGISVTINNFMNVVTDNTGSYTTWVPSGYTISCQVLQQYNPVVTNNSPVQTITAVAGQVNIIPTIQTTPCPTRAMGTIKTCSSNTLTPGFIYASWNGGNSIHFSDDGNYTINLPANTTVILYAYLNGITGNGNYTTGAQGTTGTIPEIQLCNSATTSQTAFQLNTGGNSTTFVMANMSSSSNFIDANSDGIFETAQISIQGIANPGNYDCIINMNLSQITGDYYSLAPGTNNNIIITMDSVWVYGSGLPINTTTNRLRFTDYGTPGGVASGNFEYDTGNGTVTNGTFSIIRDN